MASRLDELREKHEEMNRQTDYWSNNAQSEEEWQMLKLLKFEKLQVKTAIHAMENTLS